MVTPTAEEELSTVSRKAQRPMRSWSDDTGEVIDLAVLDELARIEWKGQRGFMDRVIKLFLQTALEIVRELGDASAIGNVTELRQGSHALKSCSAAVGAAVLSAHCEELEALARTGLVPDAVPRVRIIEQDYRCAAAALKARLWPNPWYRR